MAAPALKIPVSVDLDGLKDQMNKGREHIGSTVRQIGSQFKNMNQETLRTAAEAASGAGAAWAASAAKTVLAWGATRLAIGAAAFVAFEAIKALAASVTAQLDEMTETARKASEVTVNTSFFRGFVQEAEKGKVAVTDLENALKSAFDATKDSIEGTSRAFTQMQTLFEFGRFGFEQGNPFEVFKNAQSQEDRIRAVLQGMVELEKIGERIESLDLGEKVFGTQFADNIRRGNLSAQELLRTLESAQKADPLSSQLDQRAKDLNDRLNEAHAILSRNLKPAWDDLAAAALAIKEDWASIVEFMAKAAGLTISPQVEKLRSELAGIDQILKEREAGKGFELGDMTSGLLGSNVKGPFGTSTEDLVKRAAEIRRALSLIEGTGAPTIEGGIPLPRRRPLAATGAPKDDTGGVDRDALDRAISGIEKRAAALQAEADNIDKTTDAREHARVVAELETVAIRANEEAGKKNTEVTAEQRAQINAVADAYGKAALALERARNPLATFARESAHVKEALEKFGARSLDQLTDSLADIVTGAKSAADAFKNLANSIINDLARIAIRRFVTGPIAAGANSLFDFLPGLMAGTSDWSGGPAIVGEEGPELVNLPRHAQVLPADVTRSVGAGGIHLVVENHGADVQPEEPRQTAQGPEMRLVVRAWVQEDIGRGHMDQSMRRFGARKQVRNR